VYVTVTGGGKSKTVPVVLTKNEILLGETKYYYVANVDGRPKIRETTSTSVPEDLMPGFEWGDDPVEVIERESNSGKRLGVYWERGKPIPNGSGILPDALIRLVGRYWHADSLYKVRLSASDSYGETVSAVIEVKKPGKLHDPRVFNKPYDMTWNIRNELLNIDSLCIDYGGRIGIPPQVIKAQMFQESDKTGDRFNPSYRYEPWADYRFADPKTNEYWKDYKKQPFWVTGEPPKPMGEGEDIPLDHQNIKPVYYPTNPISIADYAIANWEKYWNSRELQVVRSRALTDLWQESFVDYFIQSLIFPSRPPLLLPDQLATLDIHQYIRSRYTDYAQTRKAASYGLIQMLYTTALVQGYNKGKTISASQAPEELNDEIVEMPFYEAFTEKNLRMEFGGEYAVVPSANWSKGWEKTWMNSFKRYNSDPGYGPSVFNHARKFSPQKKRDAL
jgi:hypothetical protein